MKIQEIRDIIDTLNWVRQDRTGGTREENMRTLLPEALEPHIAKVSALVIPDRFKHEIESRKHALNAAHASIQRWKENQPKPEKATPVLTSAFFRGEKE